MENLTWNLNLEFDIQKHKENVIKVIGVGGAGGNAVNYMFQKGIKDVDFVVVNTDAQDLTKSPIPIKVQIGKNITEGLGAGAIPEVGEKAAIEDMESIKRVLEGNTKMIFITAGMGGGTGTGAAPVIAKMAKEMGILVVGIVTSPFEFEGRKRISYAEAGIENMRQVVDSLIIINNNKLREVFGNLTYHEAFSKSDEILARAASSISEVITHNYKVNVDFRDVRTVLENSGTAIMGSAVASGENRAKEVIEMALDSPLLNDNNIKGAKNVLLLIVSGKSDFTLDEMNEINDFVQAEAGNTADIILGIGRDERLEEEIGVTIVATGFPNDQQDMIANTKPDRKIHYITKEEEVITDIPTEIKSNTEEELDNIQIDEYGNKQFVMKFEEETVQPDENIENKNEETPEDIVEEPMIENEAILEEQTPVFKSSEDQILSMPSLFDEEELEDTSERKVHHLSDYKEKNDEQEENAKEQVIKEEPKSQRINFIRKDDKIVKETKTEQKENFDDDENLDLTELPFEQALKLSKNRKSKLEKYSDKLTFGETDKPAYEKKGINVDLSQKSTQTTQRIELDRDGNIRMSDSNTFLNPGLD